MVRVEQPQAAEEAKPFFTEAELAALLKVTRGQDFEARRYPGPKIKIHYTAGQPSQASDRSP